VISNAAKNFDILATSLNVLHNYFDSSIKLFSNLYLPKFRDFSKVLSVLCLINELIFVNKGLYRAHFKTIYLTISALVSINAVELKDTRTFNLHKRIIFRNWLFDYWTLINDSV